MLNSQFWLIRDRGALVIIALFLLLLPISLRRIYATDEVQYYAYLRSIYFDGDLDFRNEYEHFAEIGERQNPPDLAIRKALLHSDAQNPNPRTGKLRNVAPIGSAIMWSPGFVLADLGVRIANSFGAGIPADGYSRPYIWSVCLMSALYALGGLLLSYRLARRIVSAFAAALATIAIWLATPLVMYTFILMPWSHATGFFLFALLLTLWLSDTGQAGRPLSSDAPALLPSDPATRSPRTWVLLGLVGGLMTLTREQLGLLLLPLAIEGVCHYVNYLRSSRWDMARALLVRHAMFLAVFAITLLPQFATYEVLNGRPLPSPTVSNKLVWCSPHFIDTLIDYDPRPSAICPIADDPSARLAPFAHGAFLWSPILVPALIGLLLLGWDANDLRTNRERPGTNIPRLRRWSFLPDRPREVALLAALLFIGFLAQVYINGAFGTTWHLNRSFGFRRLIECTPIFVLGLATLIEWLRTRSGRALPLLAAICLIYWNFGIIAQWTFVRPEIRNGLIWDGMLYTQFVRVPGAVVNRVDDVLFHRCRLANNKTC
jgi:hypothetical protein